ncbi:hypothetical protein C0J52_02411, partial [Blattella germanica]
RKILRRILGPVQDKGLWKIRTNKEVADLYQETDLVTLIKSRRLKWLGHVCRMQEGRHPKRGWEGKSGGRRNRGSSGESSSAAVPNLFHSMDPLKPIVRSAGPPKVGQLNVTLINI